MGVGEGQKLRTAPDSIYYLWPVKGIIGVCIVDRIAAEEGVTGGEIVIQPNLPVMLIDW